MSIALFLALLLITPVKLETGRFTIYQNGERVGTEEFTISAKGGGYLAEGETRLASEPGPIRSRMELDEQLNPVSYEYTRGDGAIRVRIGKPLSAYETTAGGETSSIDFRFPEGGFIVDNNFFHHYLLLLYKAGGAGSTLPAFVPQDMQVGSVTVKPKGGRSFELEMGQIKAEAVTDADGRLTRLTVPAAKVVVER